MNNFINGGISSSIALTILYLFDKIKILIQNKKKINLSRTKFYKGLPVNLFYTFPEEALRMGTFKYLSNNHSEKIASLGATLIQCIVTTPGENIKIHYQNNIKNELKLRNICRGFSYTLLRDLPFNFLFFSIYSKLNKQNTDRLETSFRSPFISGVIASSVSAFIATPFDYMKTTYQINKTFIIKDILVDLKKNYKYCFQSSFYRTCFIGLFYGITMSIFEINI